jgi:AcrR family transcriptional regulator
MTAQASPRAQRADGVRNRARVLLAAKELFASHGVGASLDEIAQRAGVGPGTVYRHFPTKRALLAAVFVESLDQRAEEGLELAGQGDGKALFELLEKLLDDGQRSLAVKDALAISGFQLKDAAPEIAAKFDRALTRLLRAAQRDGAAAKWLDLHDVKAALAGALAAQQYAAGRPDGIARARRIALRGLQPTPPAATPLATPPAATPPVE